MIKALVVFFTILFFAGIQLPAQNPYIQHYTTVDGLPSNMVYQVYQDSHKFIWFATDAGVAKYDGSKFIYFRKYDGLSSNEVIRIKEDSQGRIWFFNFNATLNYYFQNRIYNETTTPFLDSLRSKEFFRDFYEDEDKTLYFYYNFQRDIFSLDKHNKIIKYKLPSQLVKSQSLPKAEPYEGMIIRYLDKAASGKFYLWTLAGIYKLRNLSEKPSKVWRYSIKKVIPVSKTTIYVIGAKTNNPDHSVIKFPYYELRKCTNHIQFDTISPAIVPDVPESEAVSSILEDSYGVLWISTFNKGVFCYLNNKVIRHFDIKQAQAIIQDHENNIWISSLNDGVYKISPYINQHIQYENKIFGNRGILALSPHNINGIWCTNGNTIFLLQNHNLFTTDFRENESSFNQLLHLKNNKLLVGEISMRPFVLEGIQQDFIRNKLYYRKTYVSAISFKKFSNCFSGNIVITFNHFGLIFINTDRQFQDIKTVNIGERIYNTFYNSNNDLVVNARKNYIFNNNNLEPCKELACFNGKFITNHLIINDATDLLNIEGDSLFILNNKKLYNLTSAFKYPIDMQIKYMEYHEPTLFIASTRNIFVCENPLNIIQNKLINIKPVDISFRNIHDILFSNDTLYVASDDGLTVIPYHDIDKVTTNAPIPYFQFIQINDKNLTVNLHNVTLSGRNRIHIVYGSINYSANPVMFSYMLEGADKKWTLGTGTDVVYQNLPKGEYIFKLKSRKPTSPWSNPIEYHITIKATIWQHPLFYAFLSVLIAGLVFLLVIMRKNRQLKRSEMEHQMVSLEQKALQSMMNPHFIFNALGSIQHYLLQNKPGEAGLYLSKFARLIRQNLSAINSSMVILEEEIDRLKNYLDLEKLRMEDKFEYTIEFGEDVEEDEVRIPSMIIQPFVENAIWHGISAIQGMGMIRISFAMHSPDSIKISIADNGIGIKQTVGYASKSENHLHMGMAMTRKRIEIIGKKMNIQTSFHTSEASPGEANPGTCVVIVVPVSYGKSDI